MILRSIFDAPLPSALLQVSWGEHESVFASVHGHLHAKLEGRERNTEGDAPSNHINTRATNILQMRVHYEREHNSLTTYWRPSGMREVFGVLFVCVASLLWERKARSIQLQNSCVRSLP